MINAQEAKARISKITNDLFKLYKDIEEAELLMTNVELFDIQSETLNLVAIAVTGTPGMEYGIEEDMLKEHIPEGVNLDFGINVAANINVYREEHYL